MGKLEGKKRLEDVDVDGRIMMMTMMIIIIIMFQEMGWGMDWTGLAEDRDRYRIVVNAVMNLRVP